MYQSHTNVLKRIGSDVVVTTCYLINRIPTKVLKNISPYKVMNQSKLSVPPPQSVWMRFLYVDTMRAREQTSSKKHEVYVHWVLLYTERTQMLQP